MIRCAIVCNYANIAAAGSCHGYVWDSGAKECTVGTIDDSVTANAQPDIEIYRVA